jgi:phosphoglycolate phosphatase
MLEDEGRLLPKPRTHMRNLTLVFDLDGTLVDTAPDLLAATNHVLADAGLPPVPADVVRPSIGFGARHMIVEGLRRSRTQLPEQEIDHLLTRFLTFYESNIAVGSRPFDGVTAALTAFEEAGARLAVCTNKREDLSRSLLSALNLDRHFVALAGRDTFPVSKPDPEHLLGTIQMAEGDPARAIMIGDSGVDVATAKAAGVPVVACSFGYSERPVAELGADWIIHHYSELHEAIHALKAGAPEELS